ncbi:MAG: energy transducer TonB, partial [Thermodesulfobacteriota bacterium]
EPPKKEPPKKEPPKKEPPKKEPPKEKRVEKKKKQKANAKKKLEQDLAKAQKKQAEKIEKQRQTQLKNALARMKASVDSKGRSAQGTNYGGNGTGGGAGSGGGGEADPLELYKLKIQLAIQQNWVFNDVMAGLNQDLEAIIFIKILKSGDIRDISFETRSGNHYLDASAKKALQRANPLPELPKGMSSYEVVLGFSPKGLK